MGTIYTVTGSDINGCKSNYTISLNIITQPIRTLVIPTKTICNTVTGTTCIPIECPSSSTFTGIGVTNDGYFTLPNKEPGSYNLNEKYYYQDVCLISDTWVVNVVTCGGITNLNGESLTTNFNIYPNPSNGSFTIKTSHPIDIEIFNSMGMIISRSFIKETADFTISNSGVYLIKGIVNDKFIIKKIVIE